MPVARLRIKAYTLVEILVTIGIISALVSILVPVLVSSQRKASAATCISNFKTIAQAARLYVDDNDGYWMSNKSAPGFFKHYNIPTCPAYKPVRYPSPIYPDFIDTGYGINMGLISHVGIAPPVRDSTLPYPTTTVSVGEVNTYEQGFSTSWEGLQGKVRRHNGGAHFLFCDGHVKWYLPEAVGNPDDMKGNDGSRPTFDPGLFPASLPSSDPPK